MENLTKAFVALQKAGYYARENHQCCGSCGWTAIPNDKLDNVVFYHKQDAEALEKYGNCYLSWNGDPDEIIDILNSNGIRTEWNGDEFERIRIYPLDKTAKV